MILDFVKFLVTDSLDVKGFIEAIKTHLNYIYDGKAKSAKIWIRKKGEGVIVEKTIRLVF